MSIHTSNPNAAKLIAQQKRSRKIVLWIFALILVAALVVRLIVAIRAAAAEEEAVAALGEAAGVPPATAKPVTVTTGWAEWLMRYRESRLLPADHTWELGLPDKKPSVTVTRADPRVTVDLPHDGWLVVTIPHEFSYRGRGEANFVGHPNAELSVLAKSGQISHASASRPVNRVRGTLFRFRAWEPRQKLVITLGYRQRKFLDR